MKPSDVSQEAWDAADKLIVALEEEEHVDFSNDGRITEAYMDRQYAAIQATIARAIMAAKTEEREACAKIAEDSGLIQAEESEWGEGANDAKRLISKAIRSRT